MSLEKAVIPVSFAGGIDTKTDDKQVVPGKLLLLENAKFQTAKQLRKVPGDQALSKTIIGSSDLIDNAVRIASFKNELVLNNGSKFFSYSPDENSWADKGPTFTVSMDTSPVVRDNYAQTAQDSATHSSGLQVFAWEDTQGGVRYSVIDSSTNLQIVSNKLVNSTGATPRCIAIGNYLIIIYYDTTGTRLVYNSINISTPSTLDTLVQLDSNVDPTNPNIDATVINTRAFFAYNNDGGGISVGYLDQFLSQSATRTVAGDPASGAIAVFGDASNNVWVGYYNGTAVKYFIFVYNLPLTPLLSTQTVETIANVVNLTGIVSDTTGTFLYEISATLSFDHRIKSNTGTLTGTIGTPQSVIRSLGLAGKAFSYDSTIFVLATYEGPLQPTYFLITSIGTVAAKISPLTGGGLTNKPVLTAINEIASGQYQFAYLQQDFFATTSGTQFFSTGVMKATIDLNPSGLFSVDIGNGLQFNGGFLSSYDGVSAVELGFHLFPEQLESTTITGSGGGLSAGQYQLTTVYAWTDNFGQIHRSAPAIPTTVVLPTGPTPLTFTAPFVSGVSSIVVSSATGLFVGQTITDSTTGANILAGTTITSINGTTVGLSAPTQGNSAGGPGDTLQTLDVYSITNIVAPTLRVTAKQPPLRSNAWIETYRTQANQDVFYLTSSITSPLYNNTAVDTVTYSETASDIAIQGNIQLYTTGGVIENISPPAPKLIWQYKNRLILVPWEDQNTWWFSKEIVPGSPLEFTDSFVQNMDQRDGPITAGIQMDDKNIFFKGPIDIFYVVGDGPASTGLNNDFSQPQRVPAGAGCANPESLLLMPSGVIYQSLKGIYLLTRSLESIYIGAEVEAFNGANITSSQLILNDNELRFTLDNGIQLMYDYFFSQWTTIPNVNAASSAIFQNQFCYVQPDGLVLQENPNIWTHNGNVRRIKLVTSWLSFAGLQGFKRIYKIEVLGKYFSPHRLKFSVAVNFNPNPVQNEYINATALLANTNYGDDSPYGSGTPYGGQDQTYQWRLHMKQQKCETIQLTLEEIPEQPYGEGVAFSAISLEIGGKKGLYRMPANKSF